MTDERPCARTSMANYAQSAVGVCRRFLRVFGDDSRRASGRVGLTKAGSLARSQLDNCRFLLGKVAVLSVGLAVIISQGCSDPGRVGGEDQRGSSSDLRCRPEDAGRLPTLGPIMHINTWNSGEPLLSVGIPDTGTLADGTVVLIWKVELDCESLQGCLTPSGWSTSVDIATVGVDGSSLASTGKIAGGRYYSDGDCGNCGKSILGEVDLYTVDDSADIAYVAWIERPLTDDLSETFFVGSKVGAGENATLLLDIDFESLQEWTICGLTGGDQKVVVWAEGSNEFSLNMAIVGADVSAFQEPIYATSEHRVVGELEAYVVSNDGHAILTVVWDEEPLSIIEDTGVSVAACQIGQCSSASRFLLKTHATGSSALPSMDGFDTGELVLVWVAGSMGDSQIFGKVFAPSDVIGGSFDPNAYFEVSNRWGAEVVSTSVATLGGGGFSVVWLEAAEGMDMHAVYARQFDLDGGPIGPPMQVVEYFVGRWSNPQLARLGADKVLLTWKESSTGVQVLDVRGGDKIMSRWLPASGDSADCVGMSR